MEQSQTQSAGLDFASIGQVCGYMLLFFGGVMLIPALVDAFAGSGFWRASLVCALSTSGTGLGIVLSTRAPQREHWSVKQTFLLTTSCWIVLCFFGALPLIAGSSQLSLIDALFESVSGMTTTGATVISGLDDQSPGLLVWRSLLQWIGGVGIIVTALIVLPFLRIGGLQLFHSESSDRSDKIFSRASSIILSVALIYVGLTASCALLYAFFGMSVFDAVNHAMTTLSTGGFSTHDASFTYFNNGVLPSIATVYMLMGSMPLLVFAQVARGEVFAPFRNSQILYLFGVFFLATATLSAWLEIVDKIPFWKAVELSFFNVASIISTTGYADGDYMNWGSFSVTLFFFLIFVGGCTGSTAGGIKIFRFQILWLAGFRHMARLIHPHATTVDRYAGRILTTEITNSVLAFLSAFVATIAGVTMALSLFGLDFETSLSAAATAVCNVGPGIGSIIGPSGNYSSLPDAAKLILSAAMLLGRLELFTVLVILLPSFWRW